MSDFILALDQGTTSTRAILFDKLGNKLATEQIECKQSYPSSGWVEHDPADIWQNSLHCLQRVIASAKIKAQDIACMGVTNQRETTLIWDRTTGEAIYPAIVWQDRRTADWCIAKDKDAALVKSIQQKTGLLLDPYFSATKIAWILEHVAGARDKAARGELAFGTVDTFLLWHLTGGQVHATDATNASRTLLFNIVEQVWDEELLQLFDIPPTLLPAVLDSNACFGETQADLLGAPIAITGVLGDQQAATFGQACFQPGMIKSTYGTGCFMLLNTGEELVLSQHRLLSTIAYRLNGEVTYGLEGSIFIVGAAVQWLQDALHLINSAGETEALAESLDHNDGVYLVPAFTGLGAPYWDPHARGTIVGLTRNSGIAHFVRAALESVCYQSQDLLSAMIQDYAMQTHVLRVDGGMAANDWLLQFLADTLNVQVDRPCTVETTALGVALVAGLGAGLYQDISEIERYWSLDKTFQPSMPESQRIELYQGWQAAVARASSLVEPL